MLKGTDTVLGRHHACVFVFLGGRCVTWKLYVMHSFRSGRILCWLDCIAIVTVQEGIGGAVQDWMSSCLRTYRISGAASLGEINFFEARQCGI